MANEIIAWRYTSDNGTQFSVGVERELANQDDGGTPPIPLIGGVALAANHSLPPLPNPGRARQVLVADAAGYERRVTLMTATAPLATLGTAVVMEDSDGATKNCVSTRVYSERWRRRKKI